MLTGCLEINEVSGVFLGVGAVGEECSQIIDYNARRTFSSSQDWEEVCFLKGCSWPLQILCSFLVEATHASLCPSTAELLMEPGIVVLFLS